MNSSGNLTVSYSAVQAAFWMDLCVALGFASVYLLGLGYSNSALGLILAAGNFLGALIGPGVSSIIDRKDNVTASGVMPYIFAIRSALLIILLCFPYAGIVTTVGFSLYVAFSMSVNSLNLKLYVDAEHDGFKVNYGFARGMGSLAYVAISLILGPLITHTSVRAVPAAAFAVGLFQIVSFVLFTNGIRKGSGTVRKTTSENDPEKQSGSSMAVFARENKRFCLLLAGTVLIFFSHNTVCNFLINVVENVGGGTSEMGFINGFMAAVEIPVMLAYTKIFGRRDQASILRFAFAVFTMKAAAIGLAASITGLTAAFMLQAPSFALYTAAIVPYIDKTIPHKDSAKAQSLAFSMTTFSSVLSGTISGVLYDNSTVTNTLWVAAAICAVGSAAAIAGVVKGIKK